MISDMGSVPDAKMYIILSYIGNQVDLHQSYAVKFIHKLSNTN